MAPGSDWLANFFLITFLFGIVFTVASLLLGVGHVGGGHVGHAGQVGGHGIHINLPGEHFDVHLNVGGHPAGHGGHSNAGVDEGPGLLNMPTIMAFITWFGGAGYIFTRQLGIGGVFSVPMAVLSGL